jgi:hypothetical protein
VRAIYWTKTQILKEVRKSLMRRGIGKLSGPKMKKAAVGVPRSKAQDYLKHIVPEALARVKRNLRGSLTPLDRGAGQA